MLALLSLSAFAVNPIKKGFGMADPHCYIFNGKAYLFTTRDADSTAHGFVMPDWQIWSSNDLVDWTLERYILPTETYMGASNDCWATETVTKNGKYYFYFSNRNINTGVMVADQPGGLYKDALGQPMLTEDLTPGKEYDPTVLIDDDEAQSAYIVFGHHRSTDEDLNWYIARLNEDMTSLAEAPRKIELTNMESFMLSNDKPNLHKHGGLYYLSAGSHYATSLYVYGPYEVRGNSRNDAYGLGGRAHGNYFTWHNQWFHTWCHFYLGKDVARFRESYMTYLHYKDNGEMVSDVDYLEAHFATGVGQYDANWVNIEAEWYMQLDKAAKKECPLGGFEIQNVQGGATLSFPHMQSLATQKSIQFHAASLSGATIEVRADTADGKLLGKCKVPATGAWDKYAYTECALKNLNDVKGICFVFTGKGQDLLHLNSFNFSLE